VAAEAAPAVAVPHRKPAAAQPAKVAQKAPRKAARKAVQKAAVPQVKAGEPHLKALRRVLLKAEAKAHPKVQPKAEPKPEVKRLQKREAKQLPKAAGAAQIRQVVKAVAQARQPPHVADAIPVADVARAAVNAHGHVTFNAFTYPFRQHRNGFFYLALGTVHKTFLKPHTLFLTGKNGQLFLKSRADCCAYFPSAHRPGLLIFSHPATVICQLSIILHACLMISILPTF
jgi:hypothetical protein